MVLKRGTTHLSPEVWIRFGEICTLGIECAVGYGWRPAIRRLVKPTCFIFDSGNIGVLGLDVGRRNCLRRWWIIQVEDLLDVHRRRC